MSFLVNTELSNFESEMAVGVISLLPRQATIIRQLWCRECNYHYSQQLPVAMRTEQLCCAGCGIDGFVTADDGRANIMRQ